MVRLSTRYDEELKQQVFMLRGDEGYAHTTKTTLELGVTTHVESQTLNTFNMEVYVNVFRDVDSSELFIYDNDSLIYRDVWNSQDTARTILLTGLAYEVEHNLVAKYRGNNKCSPSQSPNQYKYLEDSEKVEPIITFDSDTVQYNPNTAISLEVSLDNESSPTYNYDQNIVVKYDGNYLTTLNTDDSMTINIPDCGNSGLHTIRLEYDGSNHLFSKIIDHDISVGYNVEHISYPSVVWVNGNQATFKGRVTDWFGNPMEGISCKWASHKSDGSGSLYRPQITIYTDADGYMSITRDFPRGTSIDSNDTRYYYYVWEAHGPEPEYPRIYSEHTEDILFLIPETNPVITKSGNAGAVYKNETDIISINTRYPYENIPIYVTGDVETVVYTNSNGIATTNIVGAGKGTKGITATLGNKFASASWVDYIQYWSPGDIHNRYYITYSASLLDLNNMFKLISAHNGVFSVWEDAPVRNIDFELIMRGVTFNNNGRFQYADTEVFANKKLNNSTIEIRKENNATTIDVDGTVVTTSYSSVPVILFEPVSSTVSDIQVTFSKLTLREL